MFKTHLSLIGIFIVLLSCQQNEGVIRESDYSETIRVACVGDSITFGSTIQNRALNSYPAHLGELLGDKWEVRNFGRSGATLLKKGDRPYWTQKEYQDALAFNPHVVIIKLGTNDSKPQNWEFKADYVSDYVSLIKSFQALKTRPIIRICYPAPVYADKWGINNPVVKDEIIPFIDEVSKNTGVRIIDLYKALSQQEENFPDKIHPNAQGAKKMAEAVFKDLKNE